MPTAFNFLGPLTNPARPAAAAIGVYDARLAPVMAQVLADRGDSALVFRGDDGLDELTTTTTSQVWLVSDGTVRPDVLDPAAVGIAPADPQALRGGDAAVQRRRWCGGCWPASRVRCAMRCCSTRPRPSPPSTGCWTRPQAAIEYGLPIAAAAVDDGSAAALLAVLGRASSAASS